jgi:hypothetical protein
MLTIPNSLLVIQIVKKTIKFFSFYQKRPKKEFATNKAKAKS